MPLRAAISGSSYDSSRRGKSPFNPVTPDAVSKGHVRVQYHPLADADSALSPPGATAYGISAKFGRILVVTNLTGYAFTTASDYENDGLPWRPVVSLSLSTSAGAYPRLAVVRHVSSSTIRPSTLGATQDNYRVARSPLWCAEVVPCATVSFSPAAPGLMPKLSGTLRTRSAVLVPELSSAWTRARD